LAAAQEPDLDGLQRRMLGAVEVLRQEFAGLRTGRASPNLLDPVTVDAYGSQLPINQVASSTPKLTITDDTASAVANGVSVNFTFQFDQAVTGFTASDVVVTNGGIKGPLIQLDAKTWVMSVNTPTFGAGDMTVSVADGSFTATTGGASGVGSSSGAPAALSTPRKAAAPASHAARSAAVAGALPLPEDRGRAGRHARGEQAPVHLVPRDG
jgi:hypothetical protein